MYYVYIYIYIIFVKGAKNISINIFSLNVIFNTVLLLIGKPEGKPHHGCPFCDMSQPYTSKDYHLYTLDSLYSWHQVNMKAIFIYI